MSGVILKNLPKSTAELEINIPWSEVKVSYEKTFTDLVKEIEIPGFRKGKAPRKLIEEKINRSHVYERVVKDLIPQVYTKAIQEHKLTPISAPKIEVLKAKEGEDWVIKATIALKPLINLKNYKQKLTTLKGVKAKIWTPGKPEEKKEDKKTSLEEILKALLEEVEVELSDLLISEEANRLLANLVDQTQKLGLTVEQYLMAKGKTTEQIRAEYAKQAADNLKIEFILAEIADKENITVSKEDIDGLISKVKDTQEQERLKKDSYYLAHLIRQQKTIDYLSNL